MNKVVNVKKRNSHVLSSMKTLFASALLACTSLSTFAQECLSDGLETTPNDNFEAVTTSSLLDTTTDLFKPSWVTQGASSQTELDKVPLYNYNFKMLETPRRRLH